MKSTQQKWYESRLSNLSNKKWKKVLDVQKPYRKNLLSMNPGKTLDIGCGVGRYLKELPKGSVGIDHNEYCVSKLRQLELEAFVPKEFYKKFNPKKNSFDSLLLSHVMEHLKKNEQADILSGYLPFLKKGGKVIIFCPQEVGFRSDTTHISFFSEKEFESIAKKLNLKIIENKSFPFPRFFGRYFKYNEFVFLAIKN